MRFSSYINSKKFKANDDNWYISMTKREGQENIEYNYGPFDTKEKMDMYIKDNLQGIGYFWLDASGIKPVPIKLRGN